MTTVTRIYRVVIDAKPEVVFAYVSDLTKHPEWSGGHLEIEALTSGPVAVGNQYRSHGEVATEKNRLNELRVTGYEPPTRFAFVAKDPDFGEVSHVFTFTPQAGWTLMERVVTIIMPPWVAFAFRTFIYPIIGKPMMDRSLRQLKGKLEQRAAGDPVR